MRKIIVLIFSFLLLLSCVSCAQTRRDELLTDLLNAQKHGKVYYSQFDYYAPRDNKKLANSAARQKLGVDIKMYGVDFYYASGTWFTPSSINNCRTNLVYIIRKMWKEHKAVPNFTWHLENPYVPSDFKEYMGCRYMGSVKGYPKEHLFVINEILNATGSACGYGNFSHKDNKTGYKNPRAWFDVRCQEIAGIINQLVDDNGQPIPIIFRLWHECEDSWQWWGAKYCSAEDYKKFFILTERLIKKNAPKSQILWCYCPDRYWKTDSDYMTRYPGDAYVDILGFDDYSIGTTKANLQETIRKSRIVSNIACEKGKVSGLMETANSNEKTSNNFFKNYINKILADKQVSFSIVQTWSTGKLNTKEQIKDRKKFLKHKNIIVCK